MLSLRKINLIQASTYYSKENYYTQQQGEYFGKLKDELGLSDLTHDSFQDLLKGINPATDETLVGKNKKSTVPAFDFTFSPSKSISVAYELAIEKKDFKLAESLAKAHDNAVNNALTHIEQEHIKARVQKNGKRSSLNTGNLIAAKFQHDINRDLAPQIHTHSVCFNITKIDGKYKALDMSKLLKKGSPIIKNIGLYYRQNLKQELQKQGFELRETDKDKCFYELKEVDETLIKAFSTRSESIKEKMKELKKTHPYLTNSQLSLRAFFNTRVSKKEVDRDVVRTKNVELMAKHTDVKKLLEKLNINHKSQKVEIPKQEVQNIINEVKNELNKWNKTPLNIAAKTITKLPINSNLNIDELHKQIKKQEKHEKQELNTMFQVVQNQLQISAKNTANLKATLKELSNLSNIEKEINLENRRPTSERVRAFTINRSKSDSITRADETHDRDAAGTIPEAERGRGADESERYDITEYRDDRDDSQRSLREAIRYAEQSGNRQELKNRDTGVER